MNYQKSSTNLKVFRLFLSCVVMTCMTFSVSANERKIILGDWISEGSQETRTLTLKADNGGEFVSAHSIGICRASLKVGYDGDFLQANGLAENCQKKGNAVTFEFVCQQMSPNIMHCNIQSTHVASGSAKQGVETFRR